VGFIVDVAAFLPDNPSPPSVDMLIGRPSRLPRSLLPAGSRCCSCNRAHAQTRRSAATSERFILILFLGKSNDRLGFRPLEFHRLYRRSEPVPHNTNTKRNRGTDTLSRWVASQSSLPSRIVCLLLSASTFRAASRFPSRFVCCKFSRGVC